MSDFSDITSSPEPSVDDLIQSCNEKVASTYNKYCNQDGSSTLVNTELPGYANIIYHFYTTGVITYKMGGKKYEDGWTREEYGERELSNSRRLEFKFGKDSKSFNASYVILPVDQCIQLRKEMEQIIQLAQSTGYFTPLNISQMVQDIEIQVINASKAHYPEDNYENTSFCSLIKPKESPNSNTIYMLDSNGKIEYTKGGDRFPASYFTDLNGDGLSMKIRFNFSNKMIDTVGNSYVLLTQEECHKFRQKMHKLNLLVENSK